MLFQELPESLDVTRPPPIKALYHNSTSAKEHHKPGDSLDSKNLEDANYRRRIAISSRLYPNAFIRPDKLSLFELVAPDGRVILRVERQ